MKNVEEEVVNIDDQYNFWFFPGLFPEITDEGLDRLAECYHSEDEDYDPSDPPYVPSYVFFTHEWFKGATFRRIKSLPTHPNTGEIDFFKGLGSFVDAVNSGGDLAEIARSIGMSLPLEVPAMTRKFE